MISPVQPTVEHKNSLRRNLVSLSGYSAMGFGTVCGVSAMKKKFPHRMKVHKYSAYIAGISTLLHFVAVKCKNINFSK